MKKILTLVSLVALSASAFAQTIWKDTVTFGGFPKDGMVHELYDTIYNTSSSPLTVSWNKASESLLSGWTGIGICDAASCYGYNDMATHTMVIPANGKATIDVQMKAASTAADGSSYVTITSSTFGSMVFRFISWPTAVKDFDNSNFVNVYPNPAVDFVNIQVNDKRINSINVVSIIGRRIAKFNVESGKTDPIRIPLDKVADGIYLLQFADNSGKVLGVRRITKN